MAHLPVVYSWQDLMPERFHKLQREHYDDLKSSEEVIEEDEDTLEVMKSIMEIVSWFTCGLRQSSGLRINPEHFLVSILRSD